MSRRHGRAAPRRWSGGRSGGLARVARAVERDGAEGDRRRRRRALPTDHDSAGTFTAAGDLAGETTLARPGPADQHGAVRRAAREHRLEQRELLVAAGERPLLLPRRTPGWRPSTRSSSCSAAPASRPLSSSRRTGRSPWSAFKKRSQAPSGKPAERCAAATRWWTTATPSAPRTTGSTPTRTIPSP